MATTSENTESVSKVVFTKPIKEPWPIWKLPNMLFERDGVVRDIVWKDDVGVSAEPVVQWPFSVHTLDLICSDYLSRSPYFFTLFSDYREIYGDKVWQDVMNEYMCNIQYKKGTLSYYADYLFRTRRYRDEFAAFINARKTVAHMESTGVADFLDELGEHILALSHKAIVSRTQWTLRADNFHRAQYYQLPYEYKVPRDYIVTKVVDGYKWSKMWSKRQDKKPRAQGCACFSLIQVVNKLHSLLRSGKYSITHRPGISVVVHLPADMKVRDELPSEMLVSTSKVKVNITSDVTVEWKQVEPTFKRSMAHSKCEDSTAEVQIENVKFLAQTELKKDQLYRTGQISVNTEKETIPEQQWHTSDLLRRPMLNWDFEWKTTDTAETILLEVLLPGTPQFSNHTSLFKNFNFWRGDVELTTQITGNKFQVGQLIVSFVPNVTAQTYSPDDFSLANLLACPHVKVMPSDSDVAKLTIPFVHPSNFLNLHEQFHNDWIGKLVVWVLNPLQTPSTTTNIVDGSVWVSFVDSTVHQPSGPTDVKLPNIVARKSVIRTIAHSGSGQPSRLVPVAAPNINYAGGEESTRLSLHPNSTNICVSKYSKTAQTDADLKTLLQVPTLLKKIVWTNSDAQSARLYVEPVYPGLVANFDTSVKNFPTVNPTVLAYNSRLFKFWRGGITFTMEVVASDFHRGKLMIGATTGKVPLTYEDILEQNCASVDLSTQKVTKLTVPFVSHRHWMRCDKWVCPRDLDFPKQLGFLYNSFFGIFVQNRLTHPDTVPGQIEINIFVQAAPDFELNVMTDISFLEDFYKEPNPPRTQYRLFYQNGSSSVVRTDNKYDEKDMVDKSRKRTVAHAFSQQDNEESREDTFSDSIIAGTGVVPNVDSETIGESFMNMQENLQRYQCVASIETSITSTGGRYFSVFWPNTPMLGSKEGPYDLRCLQYRTPLAHFSQQFSTWDGSLKYMVVFICDNPGVIIDFCHIPGLFPDIAFRVLDNNSPRRVSDRFLNACAPLGSMVGASNRQASFAFTVPAYKPYDILRTHPEIGWGVNAFNATGTIAMKIFTTTYVGPIINLSMKVYQAAGPDFRLFGHKGIPKMKMNLGYEGARNIDDYAKGMFVYRPATGSLPEITEDGIGESDDKPVDPEPEVPDPDPPVEPPPPKGDYELPDVRKKTDLRTYQELVSGIVSQNVGVERDGVVQRSYTHKQIYIDTRLTEEVRQAMLKFGKEKKLIDGLRAASLDYIYGSSPLLSYANGRAYFDPTYWDTTGKDHDFSDMRVSYGAEFNVFGRQAYNDWSDITFKATLVERRCQSTEADASQNVDFDFFILSSSKYPSLTPTLASLNGLATPFGTRDKLLHPIYEVRPEKDAILKEMRVLVDRYSASASFSLLQKQRLLTMFETLPEKMIRRVRNGQKSASNFNQEGQSYQRVVPGKASDYVSDLSYADPWVVLSGGHGDVIMHREPDIDGRTTAHALTGSQSTPSWNPITNMNNAMNSVHGLCARMTETVDELRGIFPGGSVEGESEEDEPPDEMFVETILGNLSGAISDFGNDMANSKGFVGWSITVANLVTGFNSYLQTSSVIIKVAAIITLVAELFGNITIAFKNFLAKAAFKILEIIPRSRCDDTGGSEVNEPPTIAHAAVLDFVPVVIALIATGALVSGFASIPDDASTMKVVKNITERLKLFNFSCSAVQNLKNTFNMLKDVITSATESVLEFCAPTLLAQMKFNEGCEEVEKWAQFIDEVDPGTFVDRCNWDMEYKNALGRNMDLAMKYNRLLINGKLGKEASVIRDYIRKISEYAQKANKAWHALPFRVDPFCICVFGKTNVGKSGMILDVLNEILDDQDFPKEDRICTINCTEEFFTENYKQQLAVLMDDFGAFKDIAQFQKFFNLKANTSFPLNMAFDKGAFFNSRVILLTTNVQFPTPVEMNDWLALWRRRDKLIEMSFVSQEMEDQAMAGNMPHKDDYSHAKFKFFCPHDPNPQASAMNPHMDYERMVNHLKQSFRAHTLHQENRTRVMLRKFGYVSPPGIKPLPRVTSLVEDGCVNPPMKLLHVGSDTSECESPIIGEQVYVNTQYFDASENVGPTIAMTSKYELDIEACSQDEDLAPYYDLFEHLIWKEDATVPIVCGSFVLKNDSPQEIVELFNEFSYVRINLMESYVDRLIRYRKTNSTIGAKIKDRLKGCFAAIRKATKDSWDWVNNKFPLLKKLFSWPLKIAMALGALVATGVVGIKLLHRCVCKTLRNYGYRCGKCGRWPALSDGNETWLRAQWAEVCGTRPYEDGYVMTLQEEQQYKSMRNLTIDSIEQGTEILAHSANYPGGNVMGSRPVRIIANVSDKLGDLSPRTFAQQGKQAQTLIEEKFKKHIYRLQGLSNGNAWYINGVAIGGRKVLIPRHFFDLIGETISILHSNVWLSVYKDLTKTQYLENKDLVCFEFPIQFHNHKDISKHFVREADLPYLVKTPSVLLELAASASFNNFQLVAEQIPEARYELDAAVNVVQKYVVLGAWKYKICTGAGSCGSMLITTSDKVVGRILGLHTAGNDKYGFSQLLTSEMVGKLLGESPKLGTPLPEVENEEIGRVVAHGHFGLVGSVKPVFGIHQPNKTDIVKTPIHGLIEKAVTAPAVLSNFDPRLDKPTNIIGKALEKYGDAPPMLNECYLDMIFESVEAEIETWEIYKKPSVLTQSEAILGIPQFDGYEKLPLNTSPGWPWVLERGKPGKTAFISEEGGVCDRLQKKITVREEMARLGERVESVWSCCLKDERRPHNKICEGSTRLFVIAPVDFSIVCRKYTLDFIEAVKINRDKSFCKLGIDPQSLEWDQLYHWLCENSNIGIAGDFKRFDGFAHPSIIERFFKHTDGFYKKFGEWEIDDSKVRQVICDELIHTPLLACNELYVKHCGNPSGSPVTTPQNSFTNYYYLALAWLEMAPDEFKNMHHFRNNVRAAIFGDDHLVSIKAEFLSWYNQETIAEFFSSIGIVYTNATKTGLTKYMKIKSATFLKQGFGEHDSVKNVIVPLMEKQTMMELLNWTRESPDPDALLQDNCNDALRFAYFHGKEYFNLLREKIIIALRVVEKQQLIIMTYSDFHFWYLVTIGKLSTMSFPKAHGMLEKFADSFNGRKLRLFNRLFFGIPYHILQKTSLLEAVREREQTDDRYAIVIPSGEGKSWLALHYPQYFVDHDALLLPAASEKLREEGLNWEKFWQVLQLDVDSSDRRILLTHHENYTGRKIVGKYILPKPVYVRANAYQRLRISKPEVLDRDARNRKILAFAEKLLG